MLSCHLWVSFFEAQNIKWNLHKSSKINRWICIIYRCLDGFIIEGGICVPAITCADEPCLNGGTCVPLPDGFECECVEGYSGIYCEVESEPYVEPELILSTGAIVAICLCLLLLLSKYNSCCGIMRWEQSMVWCCHVIPTLFRLIPLPHPRQIKYADICKIFTRKPKFNKIWIVAYKKDHQLD